MYGTRTEDEDKKGRLKSKECQFYSRNNGGAVKGVRGGGRVIGPPLARETIFSPPFRQLLQNTTEPLSLASCALSRNDRRNMPLSLSLSVAPFSPQSLVEPSPPQTRHESQVSCACLGTGLQPQLGASTSSRKYLFLHKYVPTRSRRRQNNKHERKKGVVRCCGGCMTRMYARASLCFSRTLTLLRSRTQHRQVV